MLQTETYHYTENQGFGGATKRDMSLNETCFYSRLYGIRIGGIHIIHGFYYNKHMTCNYINVVVLVKYLMEDIKVNIDTGLHHLFSYAKKKDNTHIFCFCCSSRTVAML